MHFSSILLFLVLNGPVFGLILPATTSASITMPPRVERRQAAASLPCNLSPTNGLPPICLGSFPTTLSSSNGPPNTPSSPPSTPPAILAPTPTPTCYQQDGDPGLGTKQQGCICNVGTVTKTLPILSGATAYSASCAYTDLDAATIAITANFGPPITSQQICSVCSPTVNHGATCTSILNCTPAVPSVTVQVGTSPVPVGTLTSSALFTSISSALSVLCVPSTTLNPPPSITACDETTKITISNIAFVENNRFDDRGELIIQVDSSGYNDSSILGTLIGVAAQSFVSSATGQNCNESVWVDGGGAPAIRRWGDALLDDSTSDLVERADIPTPPSTQQSATMCYMSDFASPQYYGPYWRQASSPGPQDYIDVSIGFAVAPTPNMKFICGFIEALIEAVEAAFTPELFGEEQLADRELGTPFPSPSSSASRTSLFCSFRNLFHGDVG